MPEIPYTKIEPNNYDSAKSIVNHELNMLQLRLPNASLKEIMQKLTMILKIKA